MGTRHLQSVIDKKGDKKISQYGQWDGYPSGQGADLLKYLKEGNLDKYQSELSLISEITKSQAEEVNKSDDIEKEYPHLFRDCGSDIHQLIEDGRVDFVQHMQEKEAETWCSAFYTINFRTGVFVTEWENTKSVHRLTNLPSVEDYLKDFECSED